MVRGRRVVRFRVCVCSEGKLKGKLQKNRIRYGFLLRFILRLPPSGVRRSTQDDRVNSRRPWGVRSVQRPVVDVIGDGYIIVFDDKTLTETVQFTT